MGMLILNAGEIAHLGHSSNPQPLAGTEMLDRESNIWVSGLGILIEDGIIKSIEDSQSLQSEYAPDWKGESRDSKLDIIDAQGRAIIPGLVDSHTHLIWGGDRSSEMRMRQAGMTYRQIAEMGGGIRRTVDSTRSMSLDDMVAVGISRAREAARNGTCALEAKSGYGLDTETELRLLEASSIVSNQSSIDILPTWLGAHDFPLGMERSSYIDELLNEQIPKVASQGIARWCDVFCETGWYTNEETEDIVKHASDYGLGSRLHVDEFEDSGGLALAAELGSVSADHVAHSSVESRQAASDSGIMQTFLPGTPYSLGTPLNLPLVDCIENNWAFSLATDFNPNCRIISQPLIANLCCTRMGLDPFAALVSCTRNPASTLTGALATGTIGVGASANLNIVWSQSIDGWCQTPGESPFTQTIISGSIV